MSDEYQRGEDTAMGGLSEAEMRPETRRDRQDAAVPELACSNPGCQPRMPSVDDEYNHGNVPVPVDCVHHAVDDGFGGLAGSLRDAADTLGRVAGNLRRVADEFQQAGAGGDPMEGVQYDGDCTVQGVAAGFVGEGGGENCPPHGQPGRVDCRGMDRLVVRLAGLRLSGNWSVDELGEELGELTLSE